MSEIDHLTVKEYKLLIKAIKLKQVDMDYRNHLQAYLNFTATAMKSAGKGKQRPVYRKFSKFYDYEKALRQALGEKPKRRLAGIEKILYRKEENDG